MKNYVAQAGAKLTLDNNGNTSTVDLYSEEGFDMLSNLWIKAAADRRLMYELTWLGRPVIQFPTDVVVIQELLWNLRPDLVIETGVAHGGSLVLTASILELIGNGHVLGIEIEIRPHNRRAIETHPLAKRINLIEGSSVDEGTVGQAKAAASGKGVVLVILDSNHSEAHVLKELEQYSSLVTPGSYIVAHDGAQAWVWDLPRGKAEWKDDNPLGAIDKFVAAHPDFEIDPLPTRFGITSSPRGYLRRLANAQK